MDQPIAFIVPTYNRADMIRDCLDSICRQVHPGDEIVVIDDGSNDATPATLARFRAEADHPVRIERQPNAGKSSALNLALTLTTAPWVWIVDDDDVLLPEARQILARRLADHPDCDFAYGRHDRFAHSEGLAPELAPRLGTGYWVNVDAQGFLVATLEDMFVHQPGMLVRRSLYERVGPFDESLPRSIDYEMLIRLARHGRAAGGDEVVFLQRQHDGPRGPATSQSDGALREAIWTARDREIFERMRETFPAELYLPSRQIENPRDARQALIQRGVILARKGLWKQAFEDFSMAADLTDALLSTAERTIARRAFGSKYANGQLAEMPEIRRELARISSRSQVGRDLAQALVRGYYWHVRQGATFAGTSLTALGLTLAAWFG